MSISYWKKAGRSCSVCFLFENSPGWASAQLCWLLKDPPGFSTCPCTLCCHLTLEGSWHYSLLKTHFHYAWQKLTSRYFTWKASRPFYGDSALCNSVKKHILASGAGFWLTEHLINKVDLCIYWICLGDNAPLTWGYLKGNLPLFR